MLKHYFRIFNSSCVFSSNKVFCSSSTISEKWDLVTAVCLERKPVITPLLNEPEQNFKKLLSQFEYEASLKSDHEIRHEQEVKQQQLLKKGDIDVDVTVKETAQDLLDVWKEELVQFKFGSRITEADKSNDLKSLNRKLDKHLVLLVKQSLGKKSYFLLPQGLKQDGETLRQTAERVLRETCGSDIKAQFYGNAPSGFYKYKYPKDKQEQDKTVGAKVFIYLAKHCKGQLTNKSGDFKWLDRMELANELHTNYHNSVAQFLIDEE